MRKPPLNQRGRRNVKRGVYILIHPEKYIGDCNNVIYRSGLELACFKFLDANSNVKRWGSEIVQIPYLDASTGKKRTYFVDLYFESITLNGSTDKVLVEVKPSNQTIPPRSDMKNYRAAAAEYAKNISKWTRAREWASQNGARFEIITEKEIH